jgi:glutathione S-transferase
MTAITLYGSAPTRSTRVARMLEEIGLEYDLVHAFDPRSEEFGALTPRTEKFPCSSTMVSSSGNP